MKIDMKRKQKASINNSVPLGNCTKTQGFSAVWAKQAEQQKKTVRKGSASRNNAERFLKSREI